MKNSAALFALAASLFAPLASATPVAAQHSSANPFQGKTLYIDPLYSSQVQGAVATLKAAGKTELAAKAAKVAKVPTFIWISQRSDVTSISGYLREAKSKQTSTRKPQAVQLVVYDLPDRDCSAGASAGEYTIDNAGESLYQAYIKAIYSEIQRVPQVQVIIVLEPDSIGNIITNLSNPKCAKAAPAYKRGISFAIATLSRLPNVAIYVDAAHAGWLGWPGNIGPTATLLAQLLNDAKAIYPGAWVRGVATDVSNYNGLGNQPEIGYDELVYAQNLAPLLTAAGYPAHFIVDQGRSGTQNYTRAGTDWCNNKYAGFGPRPSTTTPDPIIDAIAWVKPGGQGDGTSDSSSPRYDAACSSDASLIPAPEAGTWFQAYFEQLVANANPSF
ncbi:hypothetical protein M407DRAFT_27166 [Tulasnella calospora MUT 4182]|uniref:Glucanase n=1 Tax=Tulasnella calospora MUT 4182 TaxID=1051891 RepID=A0A0C3LPR5_9AGAM|nr:hypothetical protein M407DRAFT_27166 [Tulasnella calospora MUT 4182]